jgi:dGTPase
MRSQKPLPDRRALSKKNEFYISFDEETLDPRSPDSYRTPFQVDRDRVIHSYAFRRLQAKTQVFRPGEYDFYRTRLTHTLEVSQIGRSICGFLNKHSRDLNESFFIDADLVEAVCLAHDIGHAPFGHAGERELNQLMGKYGGFEGNAQTLRLLTETIWHGTSAGERVGLNPTRALLDGVLKYKRTHSSVKTTNHFIYDEQRTYVEFVHGRKLSVGQEPKSIECQIMDWADDVAYSVGDFVDGATARFITPERLAKWQSVKLYPPLIKEVQSILESGQMSHFAAHKIGEFIEGCHLEKNDIPEPMRQITNRYRYKLKVSEEGIREQQCLKQISFDMVFSSPAVQQLEYKAREMMRKLFEILGANYISVKSPNHRLLEAENEKMFEKAKGAGQRARLLSDYISGMSDDYLVRMYRRLVDPEFGSMGDLV